MNLLDEKYIWRCWRISSKATLCWLNHGKPWPRRGMFVLKNVPARCQWLLDLSLFMYTLSETIVAENPHKHLAHKVINKDSRTDSNRLKHLLKTSKRRVRNLNASSGMAGSERCVRWRVCVTIATACCATSSQCGVFTPWLVSPVRLQLGTPVVVRPPEIVLTCWLPPKMQPARVLLAHVSWRWSWFTYECLENI